MARHASPVLRDSPRSYDLAWHNVSISTMLGIVGVVLVLLQTFGLLLVLPLWSLGDCLTGKTGSARWGWLGLIALGWPGGPVVYGLLVGGSKALRLSAAALFLASLGLLGIGHANARRETVPGIETPSLELYSSISETKRLRLTGVFGSYGEPGNDDYVQALALSGDGSRLLVSGGRTLQLWDVERAERIETYEALPSNDVLAGWLAGRWLGRGDAAALSGDGEQVAAYEGSVTLRAWFGVIDLARQLRDGKSTGVVRLWSAAGGTKTLRAHRSNVSAIRFHPDGKRLVTASYDRTLAVWDLERGTRLQHLRGHAGWIHDLALSPDGNLALTGAASDLGNRNPTGLLKMWDLESGKVRFDLEGHPDRVHTVAFTSSGGRALSASFDGFRVWDVSSGKELATIPGNGQVYQVAFSPDGRFAVAGRDELFVWDLTERRVVDQIPMAGADDGAVAAVFANRYLLVGTRRGAVLRFEWKDPE